VTLIATLNPREVALEVAGYSSCSVAWGDAVRDVRAKIAKAVQAMRQQVCVCVCCSGCAR